MAGSPPQGYPPQGGQQGGYQQPQGGYQQPPAQAPYDPNAPYGVDPRTGIPYSDKQKSLAGFLQLLALVVGIGGIGRFYSGHIGIGVAQLILCCTGIGQLWSIIDGIILLTSETATDGDGRPLRPN
ncbi:MAG: TM2 domain-containing protein [Planctomycetes bacterium]|nr:TM2 domain-containing protein [Planctomycetota bacterium]